ncbi:Ig-like domain-containing protein [Fulvivirga ligni]|nr:Ig-like domain-containing protein [Fulvivirga ligni]
MNLTGPANGAIFTEGANVLISATASDAHGSIAKVEFYQGSTLLGEDFSAPYEYTWTNVAVGFFAISAKSWDNDGASSISAVVNISVESGDSGSEGCDGLATYNAGTSYSQNQEVSNVGNKYQCNVPGWCSSAAAWAYEPGVGQHWQDAWSLVGECTGGNEENQPPVVSISSPYNGSSFIPGTNVNISASASDDQQVTKVEFYSNGNYLGEDNSAPYNYSLNNVTTGSYILTAVAFDNEGLSSTSSDVNITVSTDGGGNDQLAARILNGYWHNFNNGTGFIKLRDVSLKWDVVNVSFAEPLVSATDGTLGFSLTSDAPADYSEADFKADIQYLQNQGKKVIISIGGANGAVRLETTSARNNFISSMTSIIQEYGFDGMDIDFEGHSLSLNFGDDDFANPTTPLIINTIDAIKGVCNNFGDDFILTMAPETFFVQLGYSFYGGISAGADRRAGAYLPVIHALRDKLTFLQVQYYNSGSITALDNSYYSMGNPDFYVSLVDMLLKGFPITGDQSKFFPPLGQDQVLLGVPASNGAGNGYIGNQGVQNALDYLIKGIPFGGQYQLTQNYPDLRGIMSWSINWDAFTGFGFSNEQRAYLDALGSGALQAKLFSADMSLNSFPNPFQDHATFTFEVKNANPVLIEVYDVMGKKIQVLSDEEYGKGIYQVSWEASDTPKGIYFYHITIGDQTETYKVYKE